MKGLWYAQDKWLIQDYHVRGMALKCKLHEVIFLTFLYCKQSDLPASQTMDSDLVKSQTVWQWRIGVTNGVTMTYSCHKRWCAGELPTSQTARQWLTGTRYGKTVTRNSHKQWHSDLLGETGTSFVLLSCADWPRGNIDSGSAGAETRKYTNTVHLTRTIANSLHLTDPV